MSPKENVFPPRDLDGMDLPPKSPVRITTPQRKHTMEHLKDLRELKRHRILSQSDDDYLAPLLSSPQYLHARAKALFDDNCSQEMKNSQDNRVNGEHNRQIKESLDDSSSPLQSLPSPLLTETHSTGSSTQASKDSSSNVPGPFKSLSFLDILAKGRFQNENRLREPQSLPVLLSQSSSSVNKKAVPDAFPKESDRDLQSDEPSDMELSQHVINCDDSLESDNSHVFIKQTPPFPKTTLFNGER